MKIKAIVTSFTLVALTSPVFAQSFLNPAEILSGKVTVKEIGRAKLDPKMKAQLFDYKSDCTSLSARPNGSLLDSKGRVVFDEGISGSLVTGDPQLDIILNLGKQAWQLIQENAPIVSTNLQTANALPQGIQCWNQLEKWQAIRAVDYQISFKNLLGGDVIRYVARVIYAYGGSYKGKGRYIANATVQNKEIMVRTTNVLNVDVQIPQVLNAGTTSNPNAAMQVTINVEAKNKFLPLIHHARSISFVLFGDGRPVQVIQ